MTTAFSALKTRSHALRKARVSLDRLFNLGPACILPRGSTPDFLTDSCSPAVAVAGELAASSAAVGRVNAQEEVGCWCTTVEGIKAEGEAIIFGVKMVVQLSKLSPSSFRRSGHGPSQATVGA